MDFRESLDFLYGLQRFGIKLGLDNIRALLGRLDRPEQSYPIVHVAGTNGKGSVCATLAAILQQAGLRVGLYTSPHLHSFTERIQVDGMPISEDQVAVLTRELRDRALALPLTFFEFTTAMALLHFQRSAVDVAVLEVGMGGRLDATNAVTPFLSVITSISLDHEQHLGPDLSAIAAEKGGIIKPAVPVIIGRQEPEALQVLLDIAQTQGAPTAVAGRDFPLTTTADGVFDGLSLQVEGVQPALVGMHQRENLTLALAAVALLRPRFVGVTPEAIVAGVSRVCWAGRLEWWQGQRRVLLDGAHNGAGVKALAAYLVAENLGQLHWVVGIKGDKRVDEILFPLLPFTKVLYCTEPPVEAAIAPTHLADLGAAAGVSSRVFATPAAALRAACADRGEGEVVLVAGSLFLVAAAREWLQQNGTTV